MKRAITRVRSKWTAGAAVVTLLAVLIWPAPAAADRGSIPFNPNVKIFEPNQRAILAWNGKTQILLLSTDLKASASTKILEVLPLPSEPKVKKGSIRSFRVAIQIINRHQRRRRYRNGNGKPKTRGARARPPAGRVTFFKKIGAHHISVTEVLDGVRFVAWVQNYLKSKGYPGRRIPRPLVKVVNQYIREGFKWFVFDIVQVGTRRVTTDAIQYTFATNRLYYPLKITRTETGFTRISLIVLTPYLFKRRNFVGYRYRRVRVPHSPVRISPFELQRISKDMYTLLGHRSSYRLRIWKIRGYLNKFRRDLLCTPGRNLWRKTPVRVRRSGIRSRVKSSKPPRRVKDFSKL